MVTAGYFSCDTVAIKKIGTVQEFQQTLADAQAKNQWVMLDFYATRCAAWTSLTGFFPSRFPDMNFLNHSYRNLLLPEEEKATKRALWRLWAE
jgi:hypothetical protein